jgi:hypothetical protein
MLSKLQIESFLHMQGVSAASTDEEIRSVLSAAQYSDTDIATALSTLRNNAPADANRYDGLHKIYRTDEGLKPNEVSKLLGIDVHITDLEIKNHRERAMTGGQYLVVLSLALVIAFGGIFYAMYEHKTGPFHPTVTAFQR